ncbi:MAG: diguanylate cyclase [Prochlorotrichaceae cyanobacterium]
MSALTPLPVKLNFGSGYFSLRFWREVGIVFLPFVLFFITLLSIWHFLDYKRILFSLQQTEKARIDISKVALDREFSNIKSDLLFLAADQQLQQFLKSNQENDRIVLENNYLAFSRYKGLYDQIRLLDAEGQEIVRINWHNGNPAAVPVNKLQNKRERYYFRDTYILAQNEIFVSPLDLNIENQEIERPFKPMLRFGTPIYLSETKPVGIILLNYLGSIMLDRLKITLASDLNQPMLLNPEGYWLLAPNPEDEWGFMLGNEQRTFQQVYPQAAEVVLTQEQGQVMTASGIFTFSTIYPLEAGMTSSTGNPSASGTSQATIPQTGYGWKIISFIPNSVLANLQKQEFFDVLQQIMMLATGLLIISCLVAKARLDSYNNMLALQTSEYRLRTITAELAYGLFVVDQQLRLILMNPAAEQLLGWSESQIFGCNIDTLIHQGSPAAEVSRSDRGIITALREGRLVQVSHDQFTCAAGSTIMVTYTAAPIWEANEVTGVVVGFHDISQQFQEQEHLQQLATLDPLTGIFNRREFECLAEKDLQLAQTSQIPLAVLMLDIDHFKGINDTYGHLVGDQVLRQLSDTLRKELRGSDTIARYGGEEFVLVLTAVQPNVAYQTAERLRQTIEATPFCLTEPEAIGDCSSEQTALLQITVSIGIALYPDQGNTVTALIAVADKMLYGAKAEGRNCVKMATLDREASVIHPRS